MLELPGIDSPRSPTWRGSPDLHTGAPIVRDSPLPAVGSPGWAVSLELGPGPHRGEGPAVVPHHDARLRRPLPGPGVPRAGGGVAGHFSGQVTTEDWGQLDWPDLLLSWAVSTKYSQYLRPPYNSSLPHF